MSLCVTCAKHLPGGDGCVLRQLLFAYGGSLGIEPSVERCDAYEGDPDLLVLFGADAPRIGEEPDA